MTAAALYEAKQPLMVEEVKLDNPGPFDVKVRLGATAICQSDIQFFDGDVRLRMPRIAVHECAAPLAGPGGGLAEYTVVHVIGF